MWKELIWDITYLLTPWCRVLLEKLTGLQLVKKFAAFHGTRRFITALTSLRHPSLSWASPIQSKYPHPTSWRSILILSTHPRLGLPSGLFPSGFLTGEHNVLAEKWTNSCRSPLVKKTKALLLEPTYLILSDISFRVQALLSQNFNIKFQTQFIKLKFPTASSGLLIIHVGHISL